jgi:hypothetical protein
LEKYFRKYPSLVNCTTIDWYLPWPKEALMAVSTSSLEPVRDIIHDVVSIYGAGSSPGKLASGLNSVKIGKIKTQKLEPIAEGNERTSKKTTKEG